MSLETTPTTDTPPPDTPEPSQTSETTNNSETGATDVDHMIDNEQTSDNEGSDGTTRTTKPPPETEQHETSHTEHDNRDTHTNKDGDKNTDNPSSPPDAPPNTPTSDPNRPNQFTSGDEHQEKPAEPDDLNEHNTNDTTTTESPTSEITDVDRMIDEEQTAQTHDTNDAATPSDVDNTETEQNKQTQPDEQTEHADTDPTTSTTTTEPNIPPNNETADKPLTPNLDISDNDTTEFNRELRIEDTNGGTASSSDATNTQQSEENGNSALRIGDLLESSVDIIGRHQPDDELLLAPEQPTDNNAANQSPGDVYHLSGNTERTIAADSKSQSNEDLAGVTAQTIDNEKLPPTTNYELSVEVNQNSPRTASDTHDRPTLQDSRVNIHKASPTEQATVDLMADTNGYDNYLASHEGIVYREDRTAIGDDKRTARVCNNVLNEGDHDVIVHGSKDGWPVPGDKLKTNPEQIAEAIRNNPKYSSGQPVRLLSCHSGSNIGWAQELADSLGAVVKAPTNEVGVEQIPESVAEVRNGGVWRTFHPRP